MPDKPPPPPTMRLRTVKARLRKVEQSTEDENPQTIIEAVTPIIKSTPEDTSEAMHHHAIAFAYRAWAYEKQFNLLVGKTGEKEILEDMISDYKSEIYFHRKALDYDGIPNETKEMLNQFILTAHVRKGFSYNVYGSNLDAIKSFRQSAALIPNPPRKAQVRILQNWPVYFAWITKNIQEEVVLENVFDSCNRVIGVMQKIKEALFIRKERKIKFAHYMSSSSFEKLVKGGKEEEKSEAMHFRFYSASDMRDPKEGALLFQAIKIANGFIPNLSGASQSDRVADKIKEIEAIESTFTMRDKSITPSIGAHIGSFVMEEEEQQSTDTQEIARRALEKMDEIPAEDRLDFWRSYGHDGEGFCLVFSRGIFSDEIPTAETLLPYLVEKEGTQVSKEKKSFNRDALPIYEIAYEVDCKKPNFKQHLVDLGEFLIKMDGDISEMERQSGESDAGKNVRLFVSDILNEVRFLFKSNYYKTENEARVVIFRTSEKDKDDDYLHKDKQEPPRHYVQADDEFRFDGVMLGPLVENPKCWQLRLQQKMRVKGPDGKIIWVKKSNAPYVKN